MSLAASFDLKSAGKEERLFRALLTRATNMDLDFAPHLCVIVSFHLSSAKGFPIIGLEVQCLKIATLLPSQKSA